MSLQQIVTDALFGSDIFVDHRESVYLTKTGGVEELIDDVIIYRNELREVPVREVTGETSDITNVRSETHIGFKILDYPLVTVGKDKIRFKMNKTDTKYTSRYVSEIIKDTGTDITVSV
jgi:hypothetical protein